MRRRSVIVAVAFAIVVAGAAALYFLRSPRLTPELRGYALASQHGCFGCHGPGGTGGVPNPGSEELEVPSWDGGTAMMYVENEEEIREWIRDGVPKRLAAKREQRGGSRGGDGDTTGALVHMPAYGDVFSERELDDLVACYKVIASYGGVPAAARAGRSAAARAGCFGCHGPGGLLGRPNPRSFKGYIPPWRGADYADLVRDEGELREWIREGAIERFRSNRLARFFTERQIVQMPAYKRRLSDEDIDAIVTYIQWLQESPQ